MMWFPKLEFSTHSLPFFLEDARSYQENQLAPAPGVVAVSRR